MLVKQNYKKTAKNVLVLCVDRDRDLGVKTGIKTPLIGRERNLEGAIALILSDPEEADANAMFEAIRVYDTLKKEAKKDEKIEVATISGSEFGDVGADRKLVSEINEILESIPTDEVILVTDGYTDETIIPIVESRIPVSSVRRIIVKHSKSIEETAALFSRYSKAILENPHYSRIILGLPGILLLIFAAFTILGLLYYYWIAFILILSSFMLIKGFGTDVIIKNFFKNIKNYLSVPPKIHVQISNYTAIIGALCIITGSYLGAINSVNFITTNQTPLNIAEWINILPKITGLFIKDAVTLVIIGLCTALLGKAIRYYIEHDVKLLRNAALIVSIAWSRQILLGVSDLLINPIIPASTLIVPILISILIAIASIMTAFLVQKLGGEFFVESEEKVQEFGKN